MTTDAVLGGLEFLRAGVQDLMDLTQRTHPDVADALGAIDDDLSDLMGELEEVESALFLSEVDQELFDELAASGMITPADLDEDTDSLFGDD
jgi:hypothetical protein